MRKLSGYGPSLIVLATAMLVLFLGPTAVQQLTYKQIEARMIQATHRLESNNVLAQLNQAYQDIAAFVEPSVVHISAQQSGPDQAGLASLSSGSGWIYDDDGHIVTNHHVVRDAERIEVQLSTTGQLREAQIVGYDPTTDIAVIKVAPGHLHPAVLAEEETPVAQGDLVFAFGSPFDFRFSMSSGVVSGKGRSVDALGQDGYENFIQVDAAINPGNSGGPLTDFQGHVIGMNTAIATGRGNALDGGQFAGIGLAIPLEMIKPVVTQIIETGVVEKGFLGVTVGEIDRGFLEPIGFVGEGVRITWVEPGSPAELAGVRVNDVVTAVDRAAVTSVPQLRSRISSKLPGEVVSLAVWRPDFERSTSETMVIRVKLTRLDPVRARGELPLNQSRGGIPQLGIAEMVDGDPETATRLGIDHHPGVVIERVVPNSELSRQLQPGTTIIEVMGRPVADVDEFLDRLRRYDLRRPGVRVGVVGPNGEYGTVILRVEP